MCSVSGRGRINAEARDEVIDRAGERINGNTRWSSPGSAIRRSTHDDIVGGAAGVKAAVRPHDIDLPRMVNGSRWQTRAAQSAVFAAEILNSDSRRSAPRGPTILRAEGDHAPESINRYDHCAIGLNQRLTAKAAGLVGSHLRRTPSQTAVGGSAHEDEIAEPWFVPLRVAIAVMRTRCSVIARDPVLVIGAAVVNDYGFAPVNAIWGAAGSYRQGRIALDGKTGNQPHSMLSVVDHRSIARSGKASTLIVDR